MIEFCFLMPWYIFLFAGTFDFGFYSYSLIATANAGTCPSNTYTCTNYVISQLADMPNIGTTVTTCNASPLTVNITYPTAASCPDGNACTTVQVTYVTPGLIPIPALFPGQLTITRTVTMRLAS